MPLAPFNTPIATPTPTSLLDAFDGAHAAAVTLAGPAQGSRVGPVTSEPPPSVDGVLAACPGLSRAQAERVVRACCGSGRAAGLALRAFQAAPEDAIEGLVGRFEDAWADVVDRRHPGRAAVEAAAGFVCSLLSDESLDLLSRLSVFPGEFGSFGAIAVAEGAPDAAGLAIVETLAFLDEDLDENLDDDLDRTLSEAAREGEPSEASDDATERAGEAPTTGADEVGHEGEDEDEDKGEDPDDDEALFDRERLELLKERLADFANAGLLKLTAPERADDDDPLALSFSMVPAVRRVLRGRLDDAGVREAMASLDLMWLGLLRVISAEISRASNERAGRPASALPEDLDESVMELLELLGPDLDNVRAGRLLRAEGARRKGVGGPDVEAAKWTLAYAWAGESLLGGLGLDHPAESRAWWTDALNGARLLGSASGEALALAALINAWDASGQVGSVGAHAERLRGLIRGAAGAGAGGGAGSGEGVRPVRASWEIDALRVLAHDARQAGRFREAIGLLDEALTLAHERRVPWSEASVQFLRGNVLRDLGDHDGAVAAFRGFVGYATRIEDRHEALIGEWEIARAGFEIGPTLGAGAAFARLRDLAAEMRREGVPEIDQMVAYFEHRHPEVRLDTPAAQRWARFV